MLSMTGLEVEYTALIVLTLLPLVLSAAEDLGPHNDYGRDEIWGNEGVIPWTPLLDGEGLAGWDAHPAAVWSREKDTIVASPPGDAAHGELSYNGTWSNFEFRVEAVLLDGAMLQVRFRKSEAGFYQLGFLPGTRAVAIGRRTSEGRAMLDVVNFMLEKGRTYHVMIAARGQSLTSYIDGQLVNRVTDGTFTEGGIELGVWGRRTSARFQNPMLRAYE